MKNVKFRLLFQPVYHPWVNVIERLWKAFATGHYTLKAIAAYFRVHYSTVSRVVCRRRRQ